jgi:hypothetical protein
MAGSRTSALGRVFDASGKMPANVANYFLGLGFSPEDHALYRERSEKAQEGKLAPRQFEELDDLLNANDLLVILKSRVRRSLRTKVSAIANRKSQIQNHD